VSSRIENSVGQFWKRLRSTKGCNARRKREKLVEMLIQYLNVLTSVHFYLKAQKPVVCQGFIGFNDQTQARRARWDISGRMISLTQRIPEKTQETGIHVPGGVRTRNSNKGVAADLCRRPHGHWTRPVSVHSYKCGLTLRSVCRVPQ
jgi:hypothetical protein